MLYNVFFSITQQQFPSASLFHPNVIYVATKNQSKGGKNPKAWMMREEYSFGKLKYTVI